jgi:hypothetical protein
VRTSEDKSVQKRVVLVSGLVYDPRGAVRSNDRQTRGGWGVTNGIRVDPHGFTGTYGSVEKDTVVYGSETWVCTHDV